MLKGNLFVWSQVSSSYLLSNDLMLWVLNDGVNSKQKIAGEPKSLIKVKWKRKYGFTNMV